MKKTENATTGNIPAKAHAKRAAERARLVARLGETGSPWASAAAVAQKEVVALEDQLQRARRQLLGILSQVR